MSLLKTKPFIPVVVLGIFVTMILAAANLPARLFAGDSLEGISYTDLTGASFMQGDLWVDIAHVPGLTHLVYHWCPTLSVLSWCVDLTHPAFDLSGRVSLARSNRLSLSNVQLRSLDMAALGLASSLVDARLNGRIDAMTAALSDCPMRSIERLDGQISSEQIRVFGIPAGAHAIDFATRDSAIDARLSGEMFSGKLSLANGRYSAEGEMLAPESMSGMAQSFMRPLGDNRFGWQIGGDLPC